jgi:putative membrane protein
MTQYHILESFGGFDDFLLYLAISGVLLAVFVAIYVRITPYREVALIRDNNMAAAFSLSGAIIGMVIPLANAVEYSVNPVDMAIWGFLALAIQLLVFVIARIALPNIVVDIPAGKTAPGFFLGAMSIAAGLLNAACMTY